MATAVALYGVRKRYGRTQALAGLDLSVQQGQIYGVLGPNGAGKSTALRILLGLVRPNGGTVEVWGRPVSRNGVLTSGDIGAMVEKPAFYEYFSGYRNITMLAGLSGRVDRAEIENALKRVRLWGRHIDKVGAYSHGMRQRLGIAQALVPRPRLLVLDEPAQGLDPEGLTEVRDLLRELAADGMTILLSSHLLHEVEQICDYVGIIAHGALIAEGPVGEMLSGDGGYQITVTDQPFALSVLEVLPLVTRYQTRDGAIRVWLDDDQPERLNAALVEAGVGVQALMPRRPALEEVYLGLAGSEIGAPDQTGEATTAEEIDE
jgi:ABC-2 type transport system ATP-binding protein